MDELSAEVEALLIETHRAIASSAADAARALVTRNYELTYPPNMTLTSVERFALASIAASPEMESALCKVIANATSAAFFRMFACIDGVGDPQTYDGEWLGLDLTLLSD